MRTAIVTEPTTNRAIEIDRFTDTGIDLVALRVTGAGVDDCIELSVSDLLQALGGE